MAALTKLKSYLDYGTFQPIQIASIVTLNEAPDYPKEVNEIYQSRRNALCDGLNRIGWQVRPPKGTMFVWAPIPEPYREMGSLEFAKYLVTEAEVATSPGVGFGKGGEGFVRFALIENEQRIQQAVRNLRRVLTKLGLQPQTRGGAPRRRRFPSMAYWVLKIVLTPVLRSLFRVHAEGTQTCPARGPAILASNHQSFIDSVFLPLVVRRRVTFVAKAEYFESWKTAWFFRAVGMIPLKRGGGSASERALAAAREVLMSGGVLGIYPEGTRSPDGRLYKGHTGVGPPGDDCHAPGHPGRPVRHRRSAAHRGHVAEAVPPVR